MRICFCPSGFPPIPGQKATGAQQGFVAALMAADKLASTDAVELADENDEDEEVGYHQYIIQGLYCFLHTVLILCFVYLQSKPAVSEEPKKTTLIVPKAGGGSKSLPSASPEGSSGTEGLSPTGQSQRTLLQNLS